MSPVLQLILILLAGLYAAVHLGVLVVLAVHTWYVRRGKPGLLAERWSLVDLWVGFHVALLITVLSLLSMAFMLGFLLALQSPEHLRALVNFSLTPAEPGALLALLGLLVVQNSAFVATAILYLVGKYRLELKTLGFTWDRQAIRQGVLWGAGAFLITPIVELFSVGMLRLVLGASTFERLMRWEQNTVALEAFLEMLQPGLTALAFVVLVAVVAPIGEEVFFRGFVFNALRHRLSFVSAVWISAVLFALLHASVKNFLPILVIGVLLARLYARTGSLWSSVVMHGTFNFLSAVTAMVMGRF